MQCHGDLSLIVDVFCLVKWPNSAYCSKGVGWGGGGEREREREREREVGGEGGGVQAASWLNGY